MQIYILFPMFNVQGLGCSVKFPKRESLIGVLQALVLMCVRDSILLQSLLTLPTFSWGFCELGERIYHLSCVINLALQLLVRLCSWWSILGKSQQVSYTPLLHVYTPLANSHQCIHYVYKSRTTQPQCITYTLL